MVVDDTVDTEDPAAAPTSKPDALSNAKSTAEAGRIDGFASINGYDGVWHPADKPDGADATGADLADEGDNAGSDPAARPAAEAAEARPTDTKLSTSADTEPAKH